MAEETIESILGNIQRDVMRIRGIKQILAEGKIRIAGEEITLSNELKRCFSPK